MNPINSLIVEGNLTRNPEFKETSGGFKVCNLTIAVNRSYKNSEGTKVDEVSYFDVETFGNLAENCARYCEKGRGIRVVGRIKQNRWTNQDGKPQARIMIVAEHIEFKPKFNLSKSEKEETNTEETPSETKSEIFEEEIQEKIPEEAVAF